MIRKIFREGFAAGVLGLGALSLGSSLGSAAELRAVELSASDDGAQLTLDLSEGAQHKLFTLEHPDRVVVDLLHTNLADGVRAPGPEGVVTEVRFGAQPDGTLRVVAELKSALPAHSGWAPEEEGHRLILTLGEPAAAAPGMFMSVHAESIRDRSVSGASVYVLSVHGASSEAARWLAERENAADLAAGARRDDQSTLEPVLIDAAQNQIIGVSASAAE